jgi:hypothetical protein
MAKETKEAAQKQKLIVKKAKATDLNIKLGKMQAEFKLVNQEYAAVMNEIEAAEK